MTISEVRNECRACGADRLALLAMAFPVLKPAEACNGSSLYLGKTSSLYGFLDGRHYFGKPLIYAC